MARNIIIKVTQDCNMACNYPCYYYHQIGKSPVIMDIPIIKSLIEQLPLVPNDGKLNFIFHGGEPTLAGIAWYKEVLALQNKLLKPHNFEIQNSVQTNGFVIDEEWLQFYKENDFQVGVSIDGPKHIHDLHRRTATGEPTFDRAFNTIHLLKKSNVKCGVLTVVTRDSLDHPEEILNFFVEAGLKSFDFLPNMEYTGSGELTKHSVSGSEFADFICRVFDRWVELDDETLRVRILDQVVGGLIGYCPNLCTFSGGCGGVMCLDVQGDIYPCDEYVYSSENKLGNITQKPLNDILSSEKYMNYLSCAAELPEACQRCDFKHMCAGNCAKFRLRGNEGDSCKGRKKIYRYIKRRLSELELV